jgi:glutamate dehydrogenase
MNYYWAEEEVRTKLESTIVSAFREVLTAAREYNVDMRVAAYMNAIKRVSEAMLVRKRKTTIPIAEPRGLASG